MTGREQERGPEHRSARPGAWGRLVHLLTPRWNRAQALTALLFALLGFAVVTQVRLTDTASLETMRQSELVSLLDQVTRQVEDLQREAAALEADRQELASGSDSRQAALDLATRDAADQGILTGRLPATGPGVTLTVRDPGNDVSAATMVTILEELRNAGAEAIQVNDQRLVAGSWFASEGGRMVVSGTRIEPPYRWVAIGNADTIATALAIPGGALATVRNDGGEANVTRHDEVDVDATVTARDPKFATPVAPGER